MLKKLMSVAIITAMLLSMFTALVGYAQTTEGSEAESFLSAMGIISSDTKDINAKISREEFAFMLAKAMKLDSSVSGEVRYFRDVENDSYAVNEINALAANHIISVPDSREFRPKDAVLFEEACKMIVCAMDYELIADSRGGYPTGYVKAATAMGVEGGSVGEAISYGISYDMIYNAMLAELPSVHSVDSDGNVLYTAGGDESILTEYWDVYRAEGTVEALYGMSISSTVIDEKNKVTVGGVTYECDGVNNLEALFGGYAEVFYQKTDKDHLGSIVFARKKSAKDDIVIKPENVSDADLSKITYFNDNGRETTITLTSARVIYNGRLLESSVKEKLTNINKGSITVKDSDDDGRYDIVLIKDYRNFVVSTINEGKLYNRLKTGDTLTAGEYESERVFSGEAEADFESIAVGNVLSVAQSVDGQAVEVIISTSEVSGVITQTNRVNDIWYLTLNGTKYQVEKSYGISLFGSEGQKQSPLLLDKQVKVKLDSFGNIAYAESVVDDMKAGVVIKGAVTDEPFKERVRLMILTQDGVFEELSLSDKVKVNGEQRRDSGKEILDEISNAADKLIRYTLSEDGNINAIVTAAYNGSSEYDGEKLRSIYDGVEQQWYNSGRLGTTALTTSATPIFMIPYGDTNPKEDDCAVLSYSALIDNTIYYCNAYHYSTNSVAADAAVVYYEYGNLYDNMDMYRPVVMFSRMERRLGDDGDVVNTLIGYTRGGRVEYIVPDSISFNGIEEGDMIMLNFSVKGNVIEGAKLSADDIIVVCKVNDIYTNKKPTWTQNTQHDYLYTNSGTVINDYYRADFQMSFGYICKVSGTQVAWSYGNGDNFSEAANITGSIVIYDSSRKAGDKIFVGKAADLVTYGAAGYDCSKIIFRTRGGRLWETFCYN